ncbi:MAG: type I secretion system permease/ATPase, partial [Pseudomonadota bacterium]|nr:type I secretion system permease/ATPase [Pseudomonadota bacterium]
LKARGTTVVAISHRRNLLAEADNVLLLNDGVVAKFGTRDEVMGAIKEANEKAVAQMQEQAKARAAAQSGQAAALTAPNPAQGAAA